VVLAIAPAGAGGNPLRSGRPIGITVSGHHYSGTARRMQAAAPCRERDGEADMDLGLDGKAVLVTGASRGIGRAAAATFAAEGCDVLMVARTAADLEAAAAGIRAASGRRVETCAADLATSEGAAAAIDAAARFDRLAVLVNNAGSARGGTLFDLTDEDWHDGFALKFYGALRLIRGLWPRLRESQGAVVNVTGFFARTPAPEIVLGGAINAAFENVSKALARQGLADGVNVNVVRPGMTMTDRQRELLALWGARQGLDPVEAERRRVAAMGLRRPGQPEDVAAAIVFLASPAARHVNAMILPVDGGGTTAV
jgi:3-oxoacyl-[acyl-carrier protein] reductase